MATKAELQASLEKVTNDAVSLASRLRIAESEIERFKRDAQREAGHARDCQKLLSEIKSGIVAYLAAKYGVGLQEQTEWFRGENVSTESVNEEVRLLRHLASLTSNDPPF